MGKARQCRVAIISPDLLTRVGLAAILRRSRVFPLIGQLTGAASSDLSTLDGPPELVLVETSPKIKDDVASVLLAFPQCKIVAFSRTDDDNALRASLQAGVHGYGACTPESTTGLLSVLERVGAGEFAVCPPSLAKLAKAFCDQGIVSGMPVLTSRETGVLQLLTKGASNRQIAEQLHLSVGTVKNLITQILRKLGVHNRTAVIAKTKFSFPLPNRS